MEEKNGILIIFLTITWVNVQVTAEQFDVIGVGSEASLEVREQDLGWGAVPGEGVQNYFNDCERGAVQPAAVGANCTLGNLHPILEQWVLSIEQALRGSKLNGLCRFEDNAHRNVYTSHDKEGNDNSMKRGCHPSPQGWVCKLRSWHVHTCCIRQDLLHHHRASTTVKRSGVSLQLR